MSKASRRKQRQQQEADRQRQRNAEQERAKELAAAALASLGKSIGLPQEIGVKNAKPTAGSEGGTNDCSPHDLATLEYARRQTYYSKLLTIATFVTVVITAVQWHAMFRQNSLIIDQNKEMVTQSAAAVTAANATVAAANAAKTSNDIVVKHGQLELQAWVGIENALVEWSPDTTTVTVTLPVKNYGQTPARDLVVISEAWSEPKDAISIDTVALKGDEEPANFYGPGAC